MNRVITLKTEDWNFAVCTVYSKNSSFFKLGISLGRHLKRHHYKEKQKVLDKFVIKIYNNSLL